VSNAKRNAQSCLSKSGKEKNKGSSASQKDPGPLHGSLRRQPHGSSAQSPPKDNTENNFSFAIVWPVSYQDDSSLKRALAHAEVLQFLETPEVCVVGVQDSCRQQLFDLAQIDTATQDRLTLIPLVSLLLFLVTSAFVPLGSSTKKLREQCHLSHYFSERSRPPSCDPDPCITCCSTSLLVPTSSSPSQLESSGASFSAIRRSTATNHALIDASRSLLPPTQIGIYFQWLGHCQNCQRKVLTPSLVVVGTLAQSSDIGVPGFLAYSRMDCVSEGVLNFHSKIGLNGHGLPHWRAAGSVSPASSDDRHNTCLEFTRRSLEP
jgi:hypothetical protein